MLLPFPALALISCARQPPELPTGPERQFYDGLVACANAWGWAPITEEGHATCVATHQRQGRVSRVENAHGVWTVHLTRPDGRCPDGSFSGSRTTTIAVDADSGRAKLRGMSIADGACP